MTTAGHDHLLSHGEEVTLSAAPLAVSAAPIRLREIVRCLTVIGALLMIWVTFEPFTDLRDPNLAEVATGQLVFTYLTYGALALLAVLLCATDSGPALRSLCTPVNLAFMGWMLINIAASHFPGLSLQRFMLTASVTALGFMIPLLPSSRAQLDLCLAVAAGALLAICYLGLLLIPDYAMHTAQDTLEPQLAGDWRGVFAHKNIAAPAMAMLLYLGIYLVRTELTAAGVMIAGSAALFLLNSGGKSASGFCIGIFLLVQIVSRLRSFWLKALLCFAPLLLINVLTVGSVVSPAIASFVGLLPVDPTFTGRTDIWEFAMSSFLARPFLGYGYGAFWGNLANDTPIGAAADWVSDASHSHNGYVELALTIGWPGLVLALLALLVVPLRNYQRIQAGDQNRPLADFLLTVWLFGIYLSSMETFLLDKQNPLWLLFVIAVAGLHYLSRFRLRASDRGGQISA
jgi:O-antigen ligase